MAEAIKNRIWPDSRGFVRLPFDTKVEYFYGGNTSGIARCRDLGRGGLSMTLGRYLSPGRKVLVRVYSAQAPDMAAELKGRIVWCRPTDEPERFLAGVQAFYDAPEALEDLSHLLFEAVMAREAREPAASDPPAVEPVRFRFKVRVQAMACLAAAKAVAAATALFAAGNGA